jgi:ATP-binding protein involved in chromosome partitioning
MFMTYKEPIEKAFKKAFNCSMAKISLGKLSAIIHDALSNQNPRVFSDQFLESFPQRILDVYGVDEQEPKTIKIASDGLSLKEKSHLESTLLPKLNALGINQIHFQRRNQQLPSVTPQSQGTSLKRNAFGIQRQVRPIHGVQSVIVVASGKGGVGKSTSAAHLALCLQQNGYRVGILDADIYGPSMGHLFNLTGTFTVSAEGKLEPRQSHGLQIASFALLTDVKNPFMWRGPLVSKAVEQLCFDVAWENLDFLIIDTPPGTGDVHLTLAETIPISGAIIVSTPEEMALIDAHKAASMFERLEVPLLGVIENMAWFNCSRCGHHEDLFGHENFQRFLDAHGVKVIAKVPFSKQIRSVTDHGLNGIDIQLWQRACEVIVAEAIPQANGH